MPNYFASKLLLLYEVRESHPNCSNTSGFGIIVICTDLHMFNLYIYIYRHFELGVKILSPSRLNPGVIRIFFRKKKLDGWNASSISKLRSGVESNCMENTLIGPFFNGFTL